MTLQITEVFFGPYTFKKGQQWFEVHNDGPEAINIAQAVVKRLDGQKNPKQAWVVTLPEQDFILEPGHDVVIAQRQDLGQNLCSEHKIIILKELRLEPSGAQKLCINESCVKINDVKAAAKGLESGWTTCPETVQEVKSEERQLARHVGGCQMVYGSVDVAFLGLGILVLLVRKFV